MTFNFVDQFNNEIHKNKHSTNIGKITLKDFFFKVHFYKARATLDSPLVFNMASDLIWTCFKYNMYTLNFCRYPGPAVTKIFKSIK